MIRKFAIAVALGMGQLALADTVAFDDFGLNHAYSDTFWASQPTIVEAFQFTPVLSGTTTGIDLAMCYLPVWASPEPFMVQLQQSVDGKPGAVLATWSGITPNSASDKGWITVDHPDLADDIVAGTQYYIGFTSTGSHVVLWGQNNLGFAGPHYTGYYNGNSWSWGFQGAADPTPAFTLRVAAVPEPSTLAALGLGIFAFVRRRV